MTATSILIDRWREGEISAAESIYYQHRDRVFRLACGLLGNSSDAEEVAQDALAYALNNIHRYDENRASFSTWLHTITVSRCRDRQRRRWFPQIPISSILNRLINFSDPSPTPETTVIQRENQSEVKQAIKSLSPALREAVLLRYWAGHTYREMAEILQCPVPTAQSRVRLAYKQLREKLTPLMVMNGNITKEDIA
jgi:RNA polymerase sigma-70 factor (ECF subfamily)